MIGIAVGMSVPIVATMTVYLPPTREKICIVEYKSLEVKNGKCKFKDYEIREFPMTILMPVPPIGPKHPNITEIKYQCLHKYECEVTR